MKPIDQAREVLASLPRCGAHSRQTGLPCKLPGLGAGGRCRFHGGKSTGRPPTTGKYTRANQLNRDWVRLLLGVIRELQGGKLSEFKPGRLTDERVEELLAVKLPALAAARRRA